MLETSKVVGFRNLRDQDLIWDPGLTILVGENGQGKTNMLEAIHILSKGYSFRSSDPADWAKWQQVQFSISAYWNKYEVSYKYQKPKKTLILNGKTTSQKLLSQSIPTILFTPESLAYVKDGSALRRDLVDDVLQHTNFKYELIRDFSHSLKQRNQALRDLAKNSSDLKLRNWLEAFSESYLKLASDLTLARINLIQKILPALQKTHSELTGKISEIEVRYLAHGQDIFNSTSEEIETTMREALHNKLSLELHHGYSLVGPHRHEISFLDDSYDSRYFSSQGQQRTLILAFKLAQFVYHGEIHKKAPLLLLDDVLSELDLRKRKLLVDYLSTVPTQVVVSATDLSLIGDLKCIAGRLLRVNEGFIDEHGVGSF